MKRTTLDVNKGSDHLKLQHAVAISLHRMELGTSARLCHYVLYDSVYGSY